MRQRVGGSKGVMQMEVMTCFCEGFIAERKSNAMERGVERQRRLEDESKGVSLSKKDRI